MTHSAETGWIFNYHLKTDKTMKKYIFMAAALMMMGMGMSSCSNDDVINEVEQAPKKVQLTLAASFDMGGETRADWDGLKPKFVTGDKVGVYSDATSDVTALDVTIDGDGNATISGLVDPATEYHLVFPYQAGTTYNSGTKQITGFADFTKQIYYGYSWETNTYPSTALHYVKVTGSATEATFKPLCAILRTAYDEAKGRRDQVEVYVRVANVTSPVINITNEGATVTATAKTFNHPDVNMTQFSMSPREDETICWPVAPGTVKLTQDYLDDLDAPFGVKTGTVSPGKIYNINISDR